MQLFERVAFDPGLDHAEHAPGHHDLVGLGFVAQPRGEVGDAADRGVFEPLLEADLAQRRIAKRDADAEAELCRGCATSGSEGQCIAHLHRHLHRALGVIGKFRSAR